MSSRSKNRVRRRKTVYVPNPSIDLSAGRFARKVRRNKLRKKVV